ncbi:ABC transporter, ATP-binding and permease protein [Blattabacterium sp. (Blattella germanica) str. Bge]|uniref:ABC transporter ATP-binding protein n=1 Tax=Blattabacterium sp. (Blattella germanica) TaxID=624186 RepID=UPI0001BB6113|nr:ABC transporter ATP-binding protein [Blattabacterium sp. (Blattella germanica)]ACY40221.1 ABC transporter, ATP-binding and permease protein [Blattabacterium sp. (Blattella germanica) str. Bge]
MSGLFAFSKKYCQRYKLRLCVGFLLILISNILTLLPIPYIGKSINTIKNLFISFSNASNSFDLKKEICVYASIILIVPIIGGFVKYHMRQCIITTSRMIEFDIKNEIFSHYQKLSLSFYKKNSTGDLMNRLTEDVSFIRQYIGPGIMYFVNLVVLFFMVFVQMLRINKTLTFYVILPIPILFISIYYISVSITKRSEKVQNYQSLICSFIQDTFSGIHVIKSFVAEPFFQNQHKRIISEYQKKNIELAKVDTILSSVIIFFIGTSHLLILFFGGKKYFEGEIKEIGTIAEFLTYINILIFPFIILGWVVSIVERAKVSRIRISEFLKEKPEIFNKNSKKMEIFGKVQFKNVSFIYYENNENKNNVKNKSHYTISKISFTIMKGETLILTGETGSGKTTIGRLISRLYDPYKGEILIDNLSLKNHNLYDFRNNIGYVPQESFLFSDSIYNNIALGSIKKVTPCKVYEAARKAVIEDEILNFKNGYDTVIGERGITLSGGQKQRICIARALIRNPKILIFDDSFSAIDQKTRKLIIRYIKEGMRNSTIIIITHDTSYISDFNLFIVLKDGKISKIEHHNILL